jgi:cysteine desulfurase
MNLPIQWAKGTLRFSVGRMTTHSEVDRAIKIIVKAIKEIVNDHI